MSKDFSFLIRDLETMPIVILRNLGLIRNEAESKAGILTWRHLVESVARELAISTIRLNHQINGDSVSLDDVTRLKQEIQYRHQKVFSDLFAAQMERMIDGPDEALTRLSFNTDGDKTLEEMNRRKFRIEMAIHHWREWSSNREQMESFLKSLDNTHLASMELSRKSDDPAVVTLGSKSVVKFRVRNSGVIPWPAGCYARAVWHDGSAKIRWFGNHCTNILAHTVQPGEDVVLEVKPLAPAIECDDSNSRWTMVTPGGQDFGSMFWYRHPVA